jgi:hypothetical protein
MELAQPPWAGLIWDPTLERMITTKETQRSALGVLVYGAGGTLREIGWSAEGLKRELAGLLQRAEPEIDLQRYSPLYEPRRRVRG